MSLALPLGVLYRLVLADPPWNYRNPRTGGSMKSGSSFKYPTMTVEEICALPVADICLKDSALLLWITTPLLPDGFKVMEAWDFKYRTAIYWRKIMSLGMGFWFRGQVEVCLLGIKGNIKAFRCQKPNFIQSRVTRHSEKPDVFFRLIEPIVQKYDLSPRIELFARKVRPGWDAWGYECEQGKWGDLSLTDWIGGKRND